MKINFYFLVFLLIKEFLFQTFFHHHKIACNEIYSNEILHGIRILIIQILANNHQIQCLNKLKIDLVLRDFRNAKLLKIQFIIFLIRQLSRFKTIH